MICIWVYRKQIPGYNNTHNSEKDTSYYAANTTDSKYN